jgi:hypothetical protein
VDSVVEGLLPMIPEPRKEDLVCMPFYKKTR